jgi:hypothetical protein
MSRVLLISFLMLSALPPLNAQAPPPAAAPQVEDAPPVLAVPPGYKYDPRGRRDPFVNPIPKPKDPEPAIPVVRPPGLKGVLVSEANLMGVVTSKEPTMNKVVIRAPGNKTYFAARGDALFDAVIKEIRPDAVVFTLNPQIPRPGQPPPPTNREVVRKVNPAPGENK